MCALSSGPREMRVGYERTKEVDDISKSALPLSEDGSRGEIERSSADARAKRDRGSAADAKERKY